MEMPTNANKSATIRRTIAVAAASALAFAAAAVGATPDAQAHVGAPNSPDAIVDYVAQNRGTDNDRCTLIVAMPCASLVSVNRCALVVAVACE